MIKKVKFRETHICFLEKWAQEVQEVLSALPWLDTMGKYHRSFQGHQF